MSDMNGSQPKDAEEQVQNDQVAPADDELSMALRLSQQQELERQERMRKEEEEIMRQVLELSLREK